VSDTHTANKAALEPLRKAMADFDEAAVRAALNALLDPAAPVRMPHPFGTMTGPEALFDTCYAPLLKAMPDLERRDWIVMGGKTEHGATGSAAAGITWAPSCAPSSTSRPRAT
jgi:hypothetical protein